MGMSILYLDLLSGISGDMFLGALLDLGADPQRLSQELAKLPCPGYHLHWAHAQKGNITGIKFEVHLEPGSESLAQHHHHATPAAPAPGHSHGAPAPGPPPAVAPDRTFAAIRALIAQSALSDWVRQRSIAVFQRLANAEGRIHGLPPDQVHFHEVGALDSIVDIVGACVALEGLGRPRVLASPVVEGVGWVTCAHGRFPLPAPATLAILAERRVPLTQCEEPNELVTPTGAALLAEFAESFQPMRNLAAQRVGYGLGTRDHRTRPNVLRVVLGDTVADSSPAGSAGPAASGGVGHDWETDTVAVLETNLDDLSAEVLGYFARRALAAGAWDVFHTPIQMKKGRPGVLLTVLCAAAEADRFTESILRETSAFGVRRSLLDRRKLRREWQTVPTAYGAVRVKLGRLDGALIQAAPEYESCLQVAERAGVPLKEVYAAALKALPR
jgi:hypothetical protein